VNVHVLVKIRANQHDLDEVKVMAVYETVQDLLDRVERIRKANSQYPLTGSYPSWRIGPEEDEGFFGNQPIHLKAQEVKFYSGVSEDV
jgi:hypothetical protein